MLVSCKVKPYKLIDGDNNCDGNGGGSQVMEEDGLLDKFKDTIGAKYLKKENSECFGDLYIFVSWQTRNLVVQMILKQKRVSKLAMIWDFEGGWNKGQ